MEMQQPLLLLRSCARATPMIPDDKSGFVNPINGDPFATGRLRRRSRTRLLSRQAPDTFDLTGAIFTASTTPADQNYTSMKELNADSQYGKGGSNTPGHGLRRRVSTSWSTARSTTGTARSGRRHRRQASPACHPGGPATSFPAARAPIRRPGRPCGSTRWLATLRSPRNGDAAWTRASTCSLPGGVEVYWDGSNWQTGRHP